MTRAQIDARLRRLAVLLVTQFAFGMGQGSMFLFAPEKHHAVIITTVVMTAVVCVFVLVMGAMAERERARLDRLEGLRPARDDSRGTPH